MKMLVTPLPGVNRQQLYDTLRAIQTEVSNLWTDGPSGYYERLLAYLDWANSAVGRLGSLISAADLDRLVLTKRHDQLFASVGSLASQQTERLANELVSLELKQRVDALQEAAKVFGRQLMLWQPRGRPVVADSSFYIEHPLKFEEADFPELLDVQDDPIHLLVPVVVVDELDRLKRSKDRQERWRAGYTLAVLDRLFQGGPEQATLHDPDPESVKSSGIRRGEVTVELLFDPPRHVRLPINDDEIVDRALAIKPLAGRQVMVLTYDTGQAMRARLAGLQDVKLRKPIGEEPRQEQAASTKKPSGG